MSFTNKLSCFSKSSNTEKDQKDFQQKNNNDVPQIKHNLNIKEKIDALRNTVNSIVHLS
jgi:hypothetical protein